MSQLIVNPTITAEWHALVNEAMSECGLSLDEEMESYLVFTLQRFVTRADLLQRIIGLDYLNGHEAVGEERLVQLREVGDECLLLSGLFPQRAEVRHVPVTYYVDVGQQAYANLSVLYDGKLSLADLFSSLCKQFVVLMDVLHCVREIGGEKELLTAIQAGELWSQAGSDHALQVLRRIVDEQSDIH